VGFRLYFNFGSNSEFLGGLLISFFKALTSYVTEKISYDIEKEGGNWDIIFTPKFHADKTHNNKDSRTQYLNIPTVQPPPLVSWSHSRLLKSLPASL